MPNPFKALFPRAPSLTPDLETKSDSPLIALQLAGRASWTPQNYAALSKEGYQRNPIAYRCIRLIAETAASVPLAASDDQTQNLLAATHAGQSWLEDFYGHLQVDGNAFVKITHIGNRPAAFFALRPDRVCLKAGPNGQTRGYEYDVDGKRQYFPIDIASGQSAVFHLRLFHPLSDVAGFPPLAAAAQAVDIHNEGGRWTKALLDNSARPSGALVYKGSENGQYMPGEQFDRIKAELEGAYAGARHAGRPMVLEGGLEWKNMSLSPADMDFLEARREAAREIALALGVPPMLLGIPGDNTYANYKEANTAFWRQTIIPLVTKTARGLQSWLRPWCGDVLSLSPDFNDIPALSEERGLLWQRLSAASFLTDEERRQMAGLCQTGEA